MAGSESRYGAFLKARERDGLRRDLTPVEAGDARTIRIGGDMPVVDSISDRRRQPGGGFSTLEAPRPRTSSVAVASELGIALRRS